LNLAYWIKGYLRAHGAGRVFVAPLDVLFSRIDVVEPDVLFVSRARAAEVLAEKHLVGAPALVVEVGSPGTRRTDDVIKVFRLVEARYQRVAELSLEAGDALTTPLLPGLEMPLAEIFED